MAVAPVRPPLAPAQSSTCAPPGGSASRGPCQPWHTTHRAWRGGGNSARSHRTGWLEPARVGWKPHGHDAGSVRIRGWEESEKSALRAATTVVHELAAGPLAGLRLALVHGRMKAEEKDAVMRRFKAGEHQVLVSTTVIEVGIDVPNATAIVIEHAERFGLAQLHQLRGRVGRGRARGHCFLVLPD